MPPSTTPSLVHELLAIPAIGAAGVERSIVFAHLPARARQRVRAAATEQEKVRLAAQAGDDLPVIVQMHAHYILAPQQRRQAGLAFAQLHSLADFFLPGVLEDGDRSWLRPSHRIQSVRVRNGDGGWRVEVRYVDGVVRVTPVLVSHFSDRRQARRSQLRILRATWILGLWD